MAAQTSPRTPFELSPSFDDWFRRALFALVKRPLETLLGLRELDRLYRREVRHAAPRDPVELTLSALGVNYDISPDQLEHIPKEGPLVVIANHPYGGVEGLVLTSLIRKVRPDIKVLANDLLERIPGLRECMVFARPVGTERSSQLHVGPVRQSIEWLKHGGVLGVFPAGQVSHLQLRRWAVNDREWQEPVGHLIRRLQVPVVPVFFEGHNGWAFQAVGLIHPLLRTAILPRAFLKSRGKKVVVRVGAVIPPSKLDSFHDDRDMLSYLRVRTYMLGGEGPRKKMRRLTSIRRHKVSQHAIIDPVDPSLLAAEVAHLPPEQLLNSSGEFEVWCTHSDQIPKVLHEIGRLREVTFREAGQGCGEPVDLDSFDQHYLHLFLWNKKTREVIGAYRLGQTDVILPKHGKKGLYSSRFHRFADRFLNSLNPGLELGRSFVRAEYQKQHSPMALLWKGIGTFIARNPKYKILFGTVSFSADYKTVSRQMMVAFLQAHAGLPDLAKLARAKKPARLQAKDEVEFCSSSLADLDEVSSLISGIEEDQKGIPVLLRQYLRLNAKFLNCHVDPDFGDVWAGLMLADLTQADPRILDRHLGKEGSARFLKYHRKENRLATSRHQ
jgi:putative hemolysin